MEIKVVIGGHLCHDPKVENTTQEKQVETEETAYASIHPEEDRPLQLGRQ